jgi:hypothetical protein
MRKRRGVARRSSETDPAAPRGGPRAPHIALAALLIAAAAQYTWNAFTVTPLSGYDAGGHAGYVLTIVEEGRLPHPLEGWSTFHPPLYYLLGAGVWTGLEPLGPRALGAGLRMISALAVLVAGAVTFVLVQRRHGDWRLSTLSAGLVLFLPAAAMSATMVGNEALGAGFAALSLPFVLRVQENPHRLRDAAWAGLFAGLALTTKYTGLFVAAACAVPFLRADFDRRTARSLAACALVGAAVTLPTYARNVVQTGSPVPMTRELEPMKSIEAAFIFRPRRVGDYVFIPVRSLSRPYLFHIPDGRRPQINGAMQSVWGLTHASLWYDPFGHRIPTSYHRDDVWQGPLLTTLGLVPTAVLLLGFASACAEALLRRARSPNDPLVAMSLLAVATFLYFTWRAPALVAVKGSYLLPLLAPAGLLFARGTEKLPTWLRGPVLALCALALVSAAVMFTNELVFPPEQGFIGAWRNFGAFLPDAHIAEAADRLAPAH